MKADDLRKNFGISDRISRLSGRPLRLSEGQVLIDTMEKMRSDVRKPEFCLCENKDADQLCSNCTADQRLCFRQANRTIHPLLISKLSTF